MTKGPILESLEHKRTAYRDRIAEHERNLKELQKGLHETQLEILYLRGWKIGAVVYSEKLKKKAVITGFVNSHVPVDPTETPNLYVAHFKKDGTLGTRQFLGYSCDGYKLTGEFHKIEKEEINGKN